MERRPKKKVAINSSGEPDRVWLSLERKYKVAQYESLSVGLGMSVSANPGESAREALQRVFADLREEYADVVEVMREREGI